MPTQWSSESLWAKTQVYVERANDEERDGELYPFWSHLALELLIRTILADISPVLLADRKSPKNVLYALGHADGTEPRSAGTAEIVEYLRELVDDFTEADKSAVGLMLTRRNRELHTGEPAFADLPLRAWQVDYYRIADKLLRHRGLSLEALFGVEESAAARRMLAAAEERIEKRVKDVIAAAARLWERVPEHERTAREAAANARPRRGDAKTARCPACRTSVQIAGEQVAMGTPRLSVDTEIVADVRMLPVALECSACGLRLSGHAELHAAELGDQFTLLRVMDPVEFHNIDIDSYIDTDRYIAIEDDFGYQDE